MDEFAHFKGKQAPDHLKDARVKGAIAMGEIHGIELQDHLACFCKAIKEMTVLLSILTVISFFMPIPIFLLGTIAAAFCIWKSALSAFLGYFASSRARKTRTYRTLSR